MFRMCDSSAISQRHKKPIGTSSLSSEIATATRENANESSRLKEFRLQGCEKESRSISRIFGRSWYVASRIRTPAASLGTRSEVDPPPFPSLHLPFPFKGRD